MCVCTHGRQHHVDAAGQRFYPHYALLAQLTAHLHYRGWPGEGNTAAEADHGLALAHFCDHTLFDIFTKPW